MENRKLTRTALLLALTLIVQSLRLVLPLPPLFSTFFIGSLVNMVVAVAVIVNGLAAGMVIACAAPAAAYFQGLLPVPVFILPVAVGNMVFVAVLRLLMRWPRCAVVIGAAVKAAALYLIFAWLLSFIELNNARIAAGLLFVMSWPQFITGVLGGSLAFFLTNRYFNARKQ